MLRRLSRISRRRAAHLVIALYALCVIAPAASLAFSDAASAAHCLAGDHHGVVKAHVHSDGASHEHSDTAKNNGGEPADCCGLFCVPAVAPLFATAIAAPILTSKVSVTAGNSLLGRGPDRIDRPPKSLVSL